MRAQELTTMLGQLVERFLFFVSAACPEAAAHPWFERWKRSVVPLLVG